MNINQRKEILTSGLALIVISLLVIFAYKPGIHGPFVFDDYFNIVENPAVAIRSLDISSLTKASFSIEIGPLKRPLAMISFALNHYFAEGFGDTFSFKITNMAIHLINSGLIYWLTLLLLRQTASHPSVRASRWLPWIPALVTAVWALHPLHLTSVLYVVQRMNTLSAFFVLAGLMVFMYGRFRIQNRQPYGYVLMATGMVGGTLLGILCKENAVLLPLFILVIEFILFYKEENNKHIRRRLLIFYSMLVLMPGFIIFSWLLLNPDFILEGYLGRDFTLGERLLTQPRILWFYVSLLFLPSTHRLTLFHDDIIISTGLFQPWTTAIALIGLIFLTCAALLNYRKHPIFSFSILWYLVGHALESSFISLEIAHVHRNYIPDLGLIFGIMYGIVIIVERFRYIGIPFVAHTLIIAVLTFSTHSYASTWRSTDSLAEHMVAHHPDSARSHAMLAEHYAQPSNDTIKAIAHYKKAYDLNSLETGYLIRLVMIAANTSVEGVESKDLPDRDIVLRKILGLPDIILVDEVGSESRLTVDKEILDKITYQLTEYLILPWTERRLKNFIGCVAYTRHVCEHLYAHAVRWLHAVLSNPYTGTRIRDNTYILLGRLYFEYGYYNLALQTAKRARSFSPSNPELALMEVNVHIQLNHLDAAEKIALDLSTLEISEKEQFQEKVDLLLGMIKTRREGIN